MQVKSFSKGFIICLKFNLMLTLSGLGDQIQENFV